MNFFYNGKKPSKSFDIAQILLLVITSVSIIFSLTLLDSFDDFENYFVQLLLMLITGGTLIYGVFRKKAKQHTYRIEIKNDFLNINSIKIPLENIQLYVYKKSNKFCRYHFFDNNGVLSIYSVYKDDLLDYFTTNYTNKINNFKEISSSRFGSNINIETDFGKLNYDLESGEYSIKKQHEIIKNKTPELYVCDPKYKLGKPFVLKK